MLYPELFKQLESVRWDKDIPWAYRKELSREMSATVAPQAKPQAV